MNEYKDDFKIIWGRPFFVDERPLDRRTDAHLMTRFLGVPGLFRMVLTVDIIGVLRSALQTFKVD
jgi:hypothetical protein